MFSVIGQIAGPHVDSYDFTGIKRVAFGVQNLRLFFAALLLQKEWSFNPSSTDAGCVAHYLVKIKCS